MPRRYINFLIVPEGSPRSLKFRLSFLTARVVVGLVGLLLVFVLVLSALHGRLLYEVVIGKSLKQENERLRRYSVKVTKLERDLKEYQGFVQRVAQLAGVRYPGQTTSSIASYSPEMDTEDQAEDSLSPHGQRPSSFASDSALIESDPLRLIPTGLPIRGWVTQGFATNIPGFEGEHPGIDFAAKTGTQVKATADGKVTFAGWDEVYGFLVAVDHGNGYVTYYGHNSGNLVSVGDTAIRGQVIALSGNTGRSSAPHLHYEIRKDDIPINPDNFLK